MILAFPENDFGVRFNEATRVDIVILVFAFGCDSVIYVTDDQLARR
jgi:hypothetical protein